MKTLLVFLMPAMLLIGCGQMQTNKGTAQDVLSGMNVNGSLTGQDLSQISDSMLQEAVELTETNGPQSIVMKVGGAELFIDFVENLTGDPLQTAMTINGIDIPTSIAANPVDFQGLIATMVASELEGIDILGVPANTLVGAGLQLIKGDADKNDFSQLFGTLIRGAFNMFLDKTPYSGVFEAIASPVIDSITGNGPKNPLDAIKDSLKDQVQNELQDLKDQVQNQVQQELDQIKDQVNQNQNQNNNDSKPGIGGQIIGAIGGALTGSNPLLGGVFNLITSLFK